MKRTLVLFGALAIAGCGVSSSTLEEELNKAKEEDRAYADQKAAEAATNLKKDLDKDLGKRVYDLESNGAPRNWVTEQVNASRLKTLDDMDKKLATMEKQVEDIKGRVDVVNMAGKEEILKVLSELQGITVTLVQQLKSQKEALEVAIKQLESIQVPEVPK